MIDATNPVKEIFVFDLDSSAQKIATIGEKNCVYAHLAYTLVFPIDIRCVFKVSHYIFLSTIF